MKNSDDLTCKHVARQYMTMMFMVPKSLKKKLPQPNESKFNFKKSCKTVAAIPCGWADDDKIANTSNNQ
jgi:hypothetical protein